MQQRAQFVEVEDHVIRISDIVRVTVKHHVTSEATGEYSSEEDEKEKKKRAYQEGAGSWLEPKTKNLIFPDELFRFTLRSRWIVILRRSPSVTLYNRSSYQTLVDAMGIV